MVIRPGIQPEEVFGRAFNELDYETLSRLVEEHVGSEPLVWEAKGAELVEKKRTQGLRKAVSAFANSIDGGFVLIGIENAGTKRDMRLTATGAVFPDDEPGRWVSNALGTYQLRPRPWFDVQQIEVPGEDGRRIAVVWVPPSDSPPCIADGSIYERVVGESAPVQDPARLAALYERGERRREAAREMAQREYRVLHEQATALHIGTPGAHARVCIAPLQPSPALRQYLFTRSTYDAVEQRLKAIGAAGAIGAPDVAVTHAQHALNGRMSRRSGRSLAVIARIGVEGYVAVATSGLGRSQSEALLWTWQLACDLYGAAAGSTHPFEHYLAAQANDDSGDVVRIARGPAVYPEPSTPARAEIEREIDRAANLFAWTPSGDGPPSS